MAAANAQNVQVTVEKDQSTVTLGGNKIEVSADGQKVTTYTSNGVETRAASASGAAAAEGTQFTISEDFNAVVLNNGVSIAQAADGHLVITAPGTVITKPGPTNDTAKAFNKVAPQVGEVLPDGWIFLGTSPATGKAYSLEPAATALQGVTTWYKGEDHAAAVRARQPLETNSTLWGELTGNEWLDIFNKIVKGGHNDVAKLDVLSLGGIHWSSTPRPDNPDVARARYLDYGFRTGLYKDGDACVRLVRDEPQLSL